MHEKIIYLFFKHPAKHLWWKLFNENSWQLTIFTKKLHHRFLPGFQIYLCVYLRYKLFLKTTHFSTQPQCCLMFSWIELQMLLWCCLIHITIIILRYTLCLVYLCPCLHQGLFMYDYAIYSSLINYITSLKQTQLLFVNFSYYFFLLFSYISPTIFEW